MSLMTPPKKIRQPRFADGAWIGTTAAAALLGVDPRTVRRLAREGHLHPHTLPGSIPRYSRDEVLRLAPPA
jgi:excisionase family DNA binding protein